MEFPPDPRNLHDFIEDAELIEEIRIAALDPDEPPLVFEWDDNVVAEFAAKILALSDDAVACPFSLPVPLTAQAFKHSFLVYVQTLVPGCRIIGGHDGTAGLACNLLQYGNAAARLGGLKDEPWFAAVLATRLALTGPLAIVLVPRARVSTGECDALTIGGALWA